jgi:hypothetical protein
VAIITRPVRVLPLAVALPRMLKKIETELANAGPTEGVALRQRAELIRGLLAPRQSPI